ncbi:hypothetical protein NA78x_000926 [Anatilimnocola sp. NA78]|uniref:hypothetical protein n=1 Tax=Anatilimnocola sp. NA78 TaxID=3415683 RepID=UPI003CE5BA90
MSFAFRCRVVVCFLLSGFSLAAVAGAEKTAQDLLPATVIAYAEISQPGRLADVLLDHPLSLQLQALPEYQQALQRPEAKKGLAAIAELETKLGEKLRPAFSKLTSDGVYIGFDLATQGVIVISRASEQALAERTRDSLLELARAATAEQGKTDAIKDIEHRGLKGHQVGEVQVTVHDRWIIASNKPLAQSFVLNNLLDKEPESLSGESQFAAAYAKRPKTSAWAYLDLRLLRTLGNFKALAAKKSDNPLGELLAGGIVSALPSATQVTAAIDLQPQRLAVSVAMPCDLSRAAQQKEFFFGTEGKGQAPELLTPKNTILSLSTYRDFASLWNRAPDLFDEAVNAKFVEAEAGLKTLFAGRDFADDILGNLQPGMQVVVARQQYQEGDIVPAIKLPAAALIFRMKNPAETSRIFKVTFQSIVGFINIAGGQNGIDPLDVNSEKMGDTLVVSGEYLPPDDEATRKAAPPQFNASPTAVFAGDKFILSSTKRLALEVAELLKSAPDAAAGTNTNLKVDAQVLESILADNQAQLVAQNMLEQGHDKEAAEKQVNGLLAIIKHLSETTLKLQQSAEGLQLRWEIGLSSAK